MKFLSNKLSVADQVKYEPNDIEKCCNYLTLAIKIFMKYFRIAVTDINSFFVFIKYQNIFVSIVCMLIIKMQSIFLVHMSQVMLIALKKEFESF